MPGGAGLGPPGGAIPGGKPDGGWNGIPPAGEPAAGGPLPEGVGGGKGIGGIF